MVEDFLSIADLTEDMVYALLDFADDLKRRQQAGEPHRLLEGKSIALIFEKPSLRTRITFQTGMFQLGGHSLILDMILGERESVPDVARNLERWVHGIVARTFAHSHVAELAKHASVPVINALTDLLHPCQIMADAQALREHKGGDFGSLKLAFVGDGNNVYQSWACFAQRVPINLTLVCPEGYEPDAGIVEAARREARGQFVITHDLEEGVRDADAVYTDVWASMGQEEEAKERERAFAPYQVNARVMERAAPGAVFMHCLPAHRGSEVSDEVMDAPTSIVFDQAENRLHAQKAIMATLMA